MSRYDDALVDAKEQFSNLELARKRAGLLKHFVISHLDDNLKTFELHFTANGGKVIWAETAADARKAVMDIFTQHKVRSVVKSKSTVAEEIGLNSFLEKNNIECLETSLGDYVVQVSGDKPYHIQTPIIQHSSREVAGIFHEKFGMPVDSSPEDIAGFVRKSLRKIFLYADAGVTGANFLVADTGSVAITENEGNGILSMAMPRIHVVVAGIEKLLASVTDLDLFWPLLATYANGQAISAYNSLVSGPRKADETDGPEHMYVILIDNGRSRLLGNVPQRRALSCIQCGACLNACPVYKNIGGHAYGTVYTGPIGAVISPFLTGKFDDYKHLSFASTLCGKCTEVCPVGIDLHNQLLKNRRLAVKKGLTTRPERWAMWLYKMGMKKRSRLDWLSPKKKNYFFKRFLANGWGERREKPVAVKSFAKRRSKA